MDLSVTDMNKDYYHILGLGRDADAHAIKAAFRSRALRCHPDIKPGDREAERLFKDINEAYRTLGDPLRRRDYDAAFHASAEDWHNRVGSDDGLTSPSVAAAVRDVDGWMRALRHFAREESAAVLVGLRWARACTVRLYRHRIAVAVSVLLLGVLIQQALSPSHPWSTNTARTAHTARTTSSGHRARPAGPAQTRGGIHRTPVYFLGGCLRYCPPVSSQAMTRRIPSPRAGSRRPTQRAASRPHSVYLFDGCIRQCIGAPSKNKDSVIKRARGAH